MENIVNAETETDESGVNVAAACAVGFAVYMLSRPLRRELRYRLRTRAVKAQKKYEEAIDTTCWMQ